MAMAVVVPFVLGSTCERRRCYGSHVALHKGFNKAEKQFSTVGVSSLKVGLQEQQLGYGKNKKHEDFCISLEDLKTMCREGRITEAFDTLIEMEKRGSRIDCEAYLNLLKGCTKKKRISEGRRVHSYMRKSGIEIDVLMGNSVLNMYAKCGSLEDARHLFDKMPERNVVSWSAMIAGYAQNGEGDEALDLFWKMQLEGFRPHVSVFASVLREKDQRQPQQRNFSGPLIVCGRSHNDSSHEPLEDKTMAPVQQKGRFKITSEDVVLKEIPSQPSINHPQPSNVATIPTSAILPTLQILLEQSVMQTEQIINLINHVKQGETPPVRQSNNLDLQHSNSRATQNKLEATSDQEGELLYQVAMLKRRVENLVDEVQKLKIKNLQLEQQLNAALNREKEERSRKKDAAQDIYSAI